MPNTNANAVERAWHRFAWRRVALVVLVCASTAAPAQEGPRQAPGRESGVLATVNGVPITEKQLAFYRLIRQIPESPTSEVHKKIVDQLIENELMRQFLADRRAAADPKRLAAAIAGVKADLRRRKIEPDKALRELGLGDAALRRELSLPLAWEGHLGRILTQQSIRDEFDRHRAEYDGTEVRASQIFIKAPADAPAEKVKAAEQELARVRADILSKKISFADAARKYSQAPSREQGGDLGYFAFRGPMPAEISRAVFSLQPGEVSAPFRSSFGVHLLTATDRRPGNLNLEDVRNRVIRKMSQDLWDQIVGQARAKAKIERRPAGGSQSASPDSAPAK